MQLLCPCTVLDRTQTPSDPGQERFLLKRILLKKLDLLFLLESKRSKISEAESLSLIHWLLEKAF